MSQFWKFPFNPGRWGLLWSIPAGWRVGGVLRFAQLVHFKHEMHIVDEVGGRPGGRRPAGWLGGQGWFGSWGWIRGQGWLGGRGRSAAAVAGAAKLGTCKLGERQGRDDELIADRRGGVGNENLRALFEGCDRINARIGTLQLLEGNIFRLRQTCQAVAGI